MSAYEYGRLAGKIFGIVFIIVLIWHFVKKKK